MTKLESAPKHHVCRCRLPRRPAPEPDWYPKDESHIGTEETIRRRAYEIYCERGRQPGSELDDWLRAEREVLGASGPANPGQDPGRSSI